MKRLLTFFKLDITLALRDNTTLYVLLSPLLLAAVLRLVIPSVQNVKQTFVAGPDVDSAVVSSLGDFGTVEAYDEKSLVIERVNKYDDAAGILYEKGGYTVLLEGNEDPELGEGVKAILEFILYPSESFNFNVTNLYGDPVPIREYGAAMLALLGMFIGGIIVGFNMVDEKESVMIRGLAVSPLKMVEYISARGIMALIIGLIASLISVIIMVGIHVNYPLLLIALLASTVVSLPFGFLVGSIADNQMTAFAVIKLLMVVFITLPFVSIFVPSNWQWLFFLFPNYWMFQTLSNVIVGSSVFGLGWVILFTIVSGTAMIALLFPKMKKGLKLN